MIKWLWTLPIAAAIALAAYYYEQWEHWEAYATGSYNCPPTGCRGGVAHNYNFFSGWGSDWIPSVITLIGIGFAWWWHNQCHVSGCFFPTRKVTDAGDRVCWLHHPHRGVRMTKEMLHARHHAAKRGA